LFAASVIDTDGNLPLASLTRVANLPPVFLTPVANCHLYQEHQWNWGQNLQPVSLIAVANLPPVSLIPMLHLVLCMSFEKI
jgi:hypothetical protein